MCRLCQGFVDDTVVVDVPASVFRVMKSCSSKMWNCQLRSCFNRVIESDLNVAFNPCAASSDLRVNLQVNVAR